MYTGYIINDRKSAATGKFSKIITQKPYLEFVKTSSPLELAQLNTRIVTHFDAFRIF
jgi:hypothetical protein